MAKVEFFFEKELDINLLEETFKKAFGKKFDLEIWKWRFLQNQNDDKVFISYIIEDEKLAAYYAVSPSVLRYGENHYKVALSNMTMTHPDFQGRGYFKLLAGELYRKLKENNYIGVFGFANANSHYGFRKYLNWQDLAMLNIFKVIPETFRPFLIKQDDTLNFEEKDLDKNTVELLKNTLVSKNKKIEINRDFNNYIWRLINIPSKKYKILLVRGNGNKVLCIVYKFFNNELDIIEILNSNFEISDSTNILGSALKYLQEKYIMPINLWSNLYDDEHLYLEKIGFQESVFNTYFGFIPFTQDTEFLNYKNWHIRFYDSDLF